MAEEEHWVLREYMLNHPAELPYERHDGDGIRPQQHPRMPGSFLFACDVLAALSRSKARMWLLQANHAASVDPDHRAAVERTYRQVRADYDRLLTLGVHAFPHSVDYVRQLERALYLDPPVAVDISVHRAQMQDRGRG
ncbi:MAG: hypothetical protein R2761_09685 [Acidimicrobiales bacterium]